MQLFLRQVPLPQVVMGIIITSKQKDKTIEIKTLYKRKCREEKYYQYCYVMCRDLGAYYRNMNFVTAAG